MALDLTMTTKSERNRRLFLLGFRAGLERLHDGFLPEDILAEFEMFDDDSGPVKGGKIAACNAFEGDYDIVAIMAKSYGFQKERAAELAKAAEQNCWPKVSYSKYSSRWLDKMKGILT